MSTRKNFLQSDTTDRFPQGLCEESVDIRPKSQPQRRLNDDCDEFVDMFKGV